MSRPMMLFALTRASQRVSRAVAGPLTRYGEAVRATYDASYAYPSGEHAERVIPTGSGCEAREPMWYSRGATPWRL